MKLCTAVLLLASVERALAAKILALMALLSHSHHLWNTKYLEALVERGHHVTYFSVDEYKNRPENITHIMVEGAYERFHEDVDLSTMGHLGAFQNAHLLHEWDDLVSGFLAESEAARRLRRLLETEKFDLVVHDIGASFFLLGAVDLLGRPPVVGITAFGIPTWTLDALGSPMAYSSKPHPYLPYSNDMTFWERTNNYFLHVFAFALSWYYQGRVDEHSRKCFGSRVRPVREIMDDINIIMVNANHGTDYPFPTVPGLVPVGGLHIQEPKPLPQNLKTFLDEAKDGVVYFSLGTNIRSSLNAEKIGILMKSFEQLSPVRVLWKLDLDSLASIPRNVKVEKWLPQNDVLAHPNVRLFFTHSGLLSTQEAFYHGKPIVGMPFFLDQHSNLQKCLERGVGEKLNYGTLSVQETVSTLRKVLNDPRYSERVKKASAIFRDQMEKPLDRAVYWTEYAIRHKGASHLRHSGRNLHWYQNWMLDVIALTAIFVFFASFLVYKLIDVTVFRFFRASRKMKTN